MSDKNEELSDDRVEKFLIELTALSQKHNIRIGGCGCCGSPWLSNLDEFVNNPLTGRYVVSQPDYQDMDWPENTEEPYKED